MIDPISKLQDELSRVKKARNEIQGELDRLREALNLSVVADKAVLVIERDSLRAELETVKRDNSHLNGAFKLKCDSLQILADMNAKLNARIRDLEAERDALKGGWTTVADTSASSPLLEAPAKARAAFVALRLHSYPPSWEDNGAHEASIRKIDEAYAALTPFLPPPDSREQPEQKP